MIQEIFDLIKSNPTEATVGITGLVAIVTMWLKNKEVDVASVTVIARLQMEQMTSLLEQNAQLSNDIAELRKLTSEQFEVIKELRLRIYELESNYWGRKETSRDDSEHPDRRQAPRDDSDQQDRRQAPR